MANWGASSSGNVNYTKPFDAVMSSIDTWLKRLDDGTNERPKDMGAYSVPVTTAVTLQTPGDTTLQANNAAQTLTALTLFEAMHTISLRPGEKGVFTPAFDAAQFRAFVQASIKLGEVTVLTDLVAGTATGGASALPAGQLNFGTDGTDAEKTLAIAAMDEAWAELFYQCQGEDNSQIFGVTTSAAAKNLLGLIDTARGALNLRDDRAKTLQWRGHPIYVSDVTVSGYGAAASADALYWIHPSAEPLIWAEAEASSQGLEYRTDGRWVKQYNTWGYAGLVQAAKYATVSNGTS